MSERKLVIKFSAPMAAVYLLAVTLVFEMRSVWTAMPKYSRINDLLLMALVGATVVYVIFRKHYTKHFYINPKTCCITLSHPISA